MSSARKNTHRKDTKWNVSSHAAPTPHQCKAGLGVNPSGQKRFFSSWKAGTTASPTPCMTPQTRKRIFEPCHNPPSAIVMIRFR